MKKIVLACLLLLSNLCFSQSNSINYKALIKDSNGNIIANQTITVQLQILQGVGLTNVYQETHSPNTDSNGIIILSISEGVVDSGTYATIDWGNGDHFLNVQIDIGSGLTDMGTTEFMAVPYALHAFNVENAAFKTTSGVTSNSPGTIATDDFVFGSTQLNDDNSIITDNSRMFFDNDKAAFRVGTVDTDQWDDFNRGQNSVAIGSNNVASGINSIALGTSSVASGITTSAIGFSSKATGDYSTSIGYNSESKSYGQTTIGINSTNTETPNSTIGYHALDRLFVIGNGLNSVTKKDALVMLKNGNTQLNGKLTLDDNNGNGYTLPNIDGTTNQILQTNGTGSLSWNNLPISSPFTKTSNIISAGDLDDDFVFGSIQLDEDGNSSHRSRFFFDKSKRAFRAGYTNGPSWNEGNIGINSIAMSENSLASGSFSIALGGSTEATGNSSTAIGNSTEASGGNSTALGAYTKALSYGQTTIGLFSESTVPNSTTSYNATDRLFVIGNGTNISNRDNALIMLKDGNTQLNGQLTLDDNNGNGYTLPNVDGTANQILKTNGSGNLSWDNGFTGNGTTNYIPKFTGSSVIGNSILYDNGSRIGISTTSPDYKFSVAGLANLNEGIASGTALRVNGSEALWYNGTYFSWGFGGTANYFSDSVGIGTTTPGHKLDVRNNTANYVAQIYNTSTGSTGDGLKIRIGATPPDTQNYFIGFYGGNNVLNGRIAGTGSTSVIYATTSDGRLKTKINPIFDALSIIDKMQPKKYEFKANLGVEEYGFIAQELQPILPQAVSGSPDSNAETNPMMVDYGRLTPILTAGIKELNDRVKFLEAENKNLKQKLNKLEQLEARLSSLETVSNSNKTILTDKK